MHKPPSSCAGVCRWRHRPNWRSGRQVSRVRNLTVHGGCRMWWAPETTAQWPCNQDTLLQSVLGHVMSFFLLTAHTALITSSCISRTFDVQMSCEPHAPALFDMACKAAPSAGPQSAGSVRLTALSRNPVVQFYSCRGKSSF